MICSISFKNFRGFDSLEIEGLSRCNLISGRNNSGKSSILEGIFLYIDYQAADSFLKINRFRDLQQSRLDVKVWEMVFKDENPENMLSIIVKYDDGKNDILSYTKSTSFLPADPSMDPDVLNQFVHEAQTKYSLKYEFSSKDYYENGYLLISQQGILKNTKTNLEGNVQKNMPHTQFINSKIVSDDPAINDWFSKMELEEKKQQIIDVLSVLEPQITDIRLVSINGIPSLYAKVRNRMIPLRLCGDGINRLLYILLSIYENNNSIILIDEIETGFHYSFYPKLWTAINKAAEETNCQVIATTHSMECIAGAYEGLKNTDRNFSYFRLEKGNGFSAKKFSFEMLDYAVNADMEVR